ncbi:DUF3107 domain-containing protein [Corynebacterium pyruviciproducens]|uniref:ATP-binding protein n=2 Tax=Corynebacterium pyruviciproducens TaxID=598660 RepID=S2Z031_9CORY|nr:DUF3107 domain-containing protein [Corynebacterium pyruviciproducens]EPD67640.1 hypothetical protein HMPREF1219_02053 [Corynebacterium pyruviciproducens ATCC BAA-1742]MDH4657552.1 DUF3107 domain-containing protein [Corynebacterium pyruviciproducens]MDK6565476.1 DUF3107 domain-containing protein [Corynebacterium pyruviciproducens]MDK7213447.1 DUF3107 domain-containing protein [Corynebacterium pyruviciproducens]WOT01429.1 DUF3107 domain-containing protein [Corynebacterium pyruviciproducens]
MNIKIGFTESARELSFVTNEDKSSVEQRLRDAMANGDATIEFTDEKGRQFIIRQAAISYVEVGASNNRPVGFAS